MDSGIHIPFLRIAKGNFAFGAPAVLGAADDAGVVMIKEFAVVYYFFANIGLFEYPG